MPAESDRPAGELVKRLLDGPDGDGWSCDFASEMDLISEAALEIEGLTRENERLREALRKVEYLGSQAQSNAAVHMGMIARAALSGSQREATDG